MTVTKLALTGALLTILAARPAAALAPIAWYPLLADGTDALGLNGPVNADNVEFLGGSVYCNGVYAGDPGGHRIQTPLLPALNFESFAVSVEFLIESPIDSTWQHRPVLVCGTSFRYLGATVEADGTMSLLFNNGSYEPTVQDVRPDLWHSLVMSYDGGLQVGSLYLDGQLVLSRSFGLLHGTDRDVTTNNPATGMAFKGYLRNLVVYDSAFDPAPVVGATWGGIKTLID